MRRGEGLNSLLADEVGGASFSSPSEPFTALQNHVSKISINSVFTGDDTEEADDYDEAQTHNSV